MGCSECLNWTAKSRPAISAELGAFASTIRVYMARLGS